MTGCSALTSLPGDMLVGGEIRLWGCTPLPPLTTTANGERLYRICRDRSLIGNDDYRSAAHAIQMLSLPGGDADDAVLVAAIRREATRPSHLDGD